jgi:GABA(A) receptor-associated protein
MNSFKSKPFETRIQESTNVLKKYPDRIPVILIKHDNRCPNLDKYKYLASHDMTISTLLYHIRQRTKLKPDEAIYLSVNGTVYNASELILVIYKKEKDSDEFLYITYSIENTFG